MTEDARQFGRIYLTDADYYEEGDGPILWCYERIRDDDVEYVNIAAYDAQAERIAELEAQLQSFRDFNAPLLKTAAEEEPGAWDQLQEENNNDGKEPAQVTSV